MPDLRTLLDPRSIAVVGASPRGNRGMQILTNLRRFGSTARIYPVHPRAETVAGLRAYPDLASLPETCDFAAIALEADAALDVLEQAIEAGTRAGLLIASGFGEGSSGTQRRGRLDRMLAESGFRLCGPNCYGIVNLSAGFAAYGGQIVDPFEVGRVALVMQSGALTHSVTDSAVGRGLGLSHLITTGNEASVTLGQYVRALAHDDAVDVIGVFIEGLRDADDFADAAIEAANLGKPVVALTVGRSAPGQRAALAHTGAIAGRGEALSGLLRRCGVVQADDLDEFRETLLLFSARTAPTAQGVAIASISGGGTGLLADRTDELGVPVAELESTTVDQLSGILPDFATVANPLDLTGAAAENPDLASGALAALQTDPSVGLVVLALNVLRGSAGQADLYREQARILAKRAKEPGAPVVAMSLTGGEADEVVMRTLGDHDIPLLGGTTPSLKALAALMDWHRRSTPTSIDRSPTSHSRPLPPGRVAAGETAIAILADAGISVPPSYVAADPAGVAARWDELTTPVVLKVESAGLAHKTEVGGVTTNIRTRDELRAAATRMEAAVRDAQRAVDGYLVQSQVTEPAVECIVGVVRDPQVGLVLTVAPGGVLTELAGPAATTPIPASSAEIEYLLDASPLGALLDGYRGAPRADREALVQLVVDFGALAASLGPELHAAELNPVLVLSEGRGAVAVDALFVKEES